MHTLETKLKSFFTQKEKYVKSTAEQKKPKTKQQALLWF